MSGVVGSGPLSGVRVIDITNDMGRFATKLLAEAGASVIRVASEVDSGPPMGNADAAALGGLLDWWFDGGKLSVNLDLRDARDQDQYRLLAAEADLIIDTIPPGYLRELGLDHQSLAKSNPRLVQVSLTPFGQDGPWAGWVTSDLVASALGGVLSVSGTSDAAINPFGRQAYNFGSFMAAICGLAGLRSARATGRGQHVDLSLHETVVTSNEQIFVQYWFSDLLQSPAIASRQGSRHWLGSYRVAPCRVGWELITPTPSHKPLFNWMAEEGVEGATEIATLSPGAVHGRIDEIMAMIAGFAATKDAAELFVEAQRRHISFGEVQGVEKVVANPQHEYRKFFLPVEWSGSLVRRPRLPAVFRGTPIAPPQPPSMTKSVDHVRGQWSEPRVTDGGGSVHEPDVSRSYAGKPLNGIRIMDLTWVVAGPMCCRILGDLGADVIKVQSAERRTLTNDPSFPSYYCSNRSKRSVTVQMKHPDALDVAKKLVEASDVLVENFSAGVLDRWGLDYETVRKWNPSIVYVTMSGCGHEGPWKSVISYGPTIHALCGLTALSNPVGRGDVGVGYSLNDYAAGFVAAFSILSALEARRSTGLGQHVDISQLEVGSYLLGPALTDCLTNRRVAEASGNCDPYGTFLVNDVFTCREGELAITVRNERDESVLKTILRDQSLEDWCTERSAADAMIALQRMGIPAGRVQNAHDLMRSDEQLAARNLFGAFESPIFGHRPFDRFPARWSGSSLEPYRCAPSYLGEHNFEVLTQLAGMTEEDIATAMGDGLLT